MHFPRAWSRNRLNGGRAVRTALFAVACLPIVSQPVVVQPTDSEFAMLCGAADGESDTNTC
jgi:hypothetical protein